MLNPTLSAVQKRVYTLMAKFKDLHESSILDDDGYYKQLFILAYELGKEDFVDDAVTMLLKIDPNYFGIRQQKQAEEDELYKNIMLDLVEIIKFHKVVNTNTIMPNVPPGIA